MDTVTWMDWLDAIIPLFLLAGMGFALHRGFKKNQSLLVEREELLKRYLLFRGDKQVRLKIYGDNEKIYRELLKNLSNSWKNFKKAYDQCLHLFAQNTAKTKLALQLITLGFFINSARLFVGEYFFSDSKAHFIYILIRELSSYVLVALSFLLLKTQTYRFISLKGEAAKIDREILFFPNNLSAEGEREGLYNEFDPLEATGEEDGKEDRNSHQ